MDTSFRDVDVSEFADWLSRQDAERLWTVDGEEQLSGALRLPCSGAELAQALKANGSRLRIYGPGATNYASAGGGDFESLGVIEGDTLVFEISWLSEPEGQPSEHWMLAEDIFAERALSAAAVYG